MVYTKTRKGIKNRNRNRSKNRNRNRNRNKNRSKKSKGGFNSLTKIASNATTGVSEYAQQAAYGLGQAAQDVSDYGKGLFQLSTSPSVSISNKRPILPKLGDGADDNTYYHIYFIQYLRMCELLKKPIDEKKKKIIINDITFMEPNIKIMLNNKTFSEEYNKFYSDDSKSHIKYDKTYNQQSDYEKAVKQVEEVSKKEPEPFQLKLYKKVETPATEDDSDDDYDNKV